MQAESLHVAVLPRVGNGQLDFHEFGKNIIGIIALRLEAGWGPLLFGKIIGHGPAHKWCKTTRC